MGHFRAQPLRDGGEMDSHPHGVQVIGVVSQMNDGPLRGAALGEDKAARKQAERPPYGQGRGGSLPDFR